MNAVLDKIIATGLVEDAEGKSYNAMGMGISVAMARVLHEGIRNRPVQRSIELGCAYGVSSLFICDALAHKPGARHVIIDPGQGSQYKYIGVGNLERCGYDFFQLLEEPSELALPKLWQAGERFDFALIDGRHTSDHVMVDFFYIDRLLNVGGIVVFDDVDLYRVNKAVRYLVQYPSYRVLPWRSPPDRGGLPWQKKMAMKLVKLMPRRYREALFAPEIACPGPVETALSGRQRFLAMEKISEDSRLSSWQVRF